MKIHPSILSADFANLEAELATIAEADAAHVDVMDNHFVPNLTIGLPIVARLFEVSKLPLDIHLMIDNPDLWAPKFAGIGCDSVTFHLEAAKDPIGLARKIRDIGSKAAIAIKPTTQFSEVEDLLSEIDMLLVMTVEPGFGGQKLIPETVSKVSAARAALRAKGISIGIQVDGGINESNIAQLAEAGADVFVAGSAVFGADNRNLEIAKLRNLAHAH
jgi:ribulose-phosphate 3-epimerase